MANQPTYKSENRHFPFSIAAWPSEDGTKWSVKLQKAFKRKEATTEDPFEHQNINLFPDHIGAVIEVLQEAQAYFQKNPSPPKTGEAIPRPYIPHAEKEAHKND